MARAKCPKDCPNRGTGKDRIDCHNSCPIWAEHMKNTEKEYANRRKDAFIRNAMYDCDDAVMKKKGYRQY
jgi:hypothetical protein